ncbi:hypothetical protein EWM64_g9002 [Hericium alpestre]|uniref:Uncharacterized protein n=1 Tax=Hericium alpestre TaxID=135208 RepID=A0A4Y9ZL77_9AGAM|nr:hypothetical protein EWM64_g9002 [Hericium alpestre]
MVPSNWSPEEALKEVYHIITTHIKKHYPKQYNEWKAGLEKKWKASEQPSESTSLSGAINGGLLSIPDWSQI